MAEVEKKGPLTGRHQTCCFEIHWTDQVHMSTGPDRNINGQLSKEMYGDVWRALHEL